MPSDPDTRQILWSKLYCRVVLWGLSQYVNCKTIYCSIKKKRCKMFRVPMVNVDFTREFDFILGLEVSEPQSRYNRYRDIYKQAKSIFLRSPTIVFVYNVGYNYIFLPPPPLITRFFRRRLLSKTSLYTIIYLI